HVVVPINQHRRTLRCAPPLGIDKRMARCRHDVDVLETNAPQMICQPCRAPLQVTVMFGLGADAGETDEVFQFGHEALTMGMGIGEGVRERHSRRPITLMQPTEAMQNPQCIFAGCLHPRYIYMSYATGGGSLPCP